MTGPSAPGEGIDWTVGNKVVLYQAASKYRDERLEWAPIVKVGRRWATLEVGRRLIRFDMASGIEDTEGFGASSETLRAFADMGAPNRWRARSDLDSILYRELRSMRKYTTTQVVGVARILAIEIPEALEQL